MENKFYNELSKFKKAEKVELNLIRTAEVTIYELNQNDDLMQYMTNAQAAIEKGKRELNRLEAVQRIGERILKDLQSASKDLGVDIKEEKELIKAIKNFEDRRKRANKLFN